MRPTVAGWTLTRHVVEQALAKGVPFLALVNTITSPTITYPSSKPNQQRRVLNDLCVVVDEVRMVVITVYRHRIVTPLRPDQAA